MTSKSKKTSIFDDIPKEARNKEKRVLLDIFWISILVFVVAVMVLRDGKNLFEIECKDCKEQSNCNGICLQSCLREGYDTSTSSGYNTSKGMFCDCRCDHALHTLLLGKKCDGNYTNFGDYCCTDLNKDKVCDRYYSLNLLDIKYQPTSGQSFESCSQSCNDANECTQDICKIDTKYSGYICDHEKIIPCCGNAICEETEKCGSCFKDCGGCLSLQGAKKNVENVLGYNNWMDIQDVKDKVTLSVMNNSNAKILRIDDFNKVFNTYSDFKNFNFKVSSNKKSIELYNSFDTSLVVLFEKDQYSPHGIINEKIGYIKDTNNSDGFLFHEFNIMCSQDLYIRLTPNWQNDKLTYKQDYDKLVIKNQFDLDKQTIFPLVETVLDSCPLGKLQSCENCKETVISEKIIDKITNESKAFLKDSDGYYYSIENENILIIDNTSLGGLKYLDQNFKTNMPQIYEGLFYQKDLDYLNLKINEMNNFISKDPEKTPGESRFFHYASHNITKNELYNFINLKENSTVYEKGYSYLYRYDLKQEILGTDDTKSGYIYSTKDLIVTNLRTIFLCKNNLISIGSKESVIYEGKTSDEQIDLIKNKIKDNQKILTSKALAIEEECNKIN